MQKWYSIRTYTPEYLGLVYRYYASHGRSYICSYYNIDLPNSVTDKEILQNGSYELVGELSGMLWKKILMLPIYNAEYVASPFNADEKGMTKSEQIGSFNFPTTYELQPFVNDFVIFEERILDNTNRKITPNVYQVVHIESCIIAGITFWKVSLKISHYTREKIEKQLSGNYTFFDYEKHIYKTTDSLYNYKTLQRNGKVTQDINSFYKKTCGLYSINKGST